MHLSGILVPTEENTIKATVDVVEPMGATVTMYLTSGKSNIVATIDAETMFREDQAMDLVLDMEKAHLFDKKTEIAIL